MTAINVSLATSLACNVHVVCMPLSNNDVTLEVSYSCMEYVMSIPRRFVYLFLWPKVRYDTIRYEMLF